MAVGNPIAFTVGPVPVVIFPTLFVSAQLSGSIEKELQVTSRFDARLRAGAEYTPAEGLSSILDITRNGELLPDTNLFSNLSVAAALVKARLTTAIYALAGPSLGVKVVSLEGEFQADDQTKRIDFTASFVQGGTIGAAFGAISPSLGAIDIPIGSVKTPLFTVNILPGTVTAPVQ